MRILLATHFFPPGHLGGTEVLTLGLAKTLSASGCSVQVICNEEWDSAPSFLIHHTDDIYQGIPVRRLQYNWTKAPDVFRYLYNNPEVYNNLLEYMKVNKPDVLHITSLYSLSASVIQAAQEMNIPIILTATDFWFVCAKNTLLRSDGTLCPGQDDPWECTKCLMADTKAYQSLHKLLPDKLAKSIMLGLGRYPWITNRPGFRGMMGNWRERFEYQSQLLNKLNLVVTASQFLKELFLRYGVRAENITYSAYGLDTAWARGLSTKTVSKNLRIGFIGQILPMKGPDILLRAVLDLPSHLPIEVKIYGDLNKTPGYGQELVDLVGQDRRVSFLGTFDNSKMGEVMTGIDVLAVPSTWYDFPLVIPSALATNTPVIATDLPGMNEMIRHEVNGLLFERNDWKGLSTQIRRVMEERDLLQHLKNGIQPVKTVEQMGAEYLDLYAKLV
jgi:glycosyltransferase involved in cell wall biosynthesis